MGIEPTSQTWEDVGQSGFCFSSPKPETKTCDCPNGLDRELRTAHRPTAHGITAIAC
jgi:hypothetical protein